MPASPPPPTPRWSDIDGTPIPLGCRIEQITVDQDQGAMPSRLHQHARVVGLGHDVAAGVFRAGSSAGRPTSAPGARA